METGSCVSIWSPSKSGLDWLFNKFQVLFAPTALFYRTDSTFSSHCSRITRYINFIALDIFHLPTFKYDVDNLNWLKKPNSHGEFLRKSKIFKKGKFFIEFCIINMQKWSNFMKESIKYSRILWNLKQILQYSQKHSPKGHMVKLFSDVTKNLFYDKSCVFSKNSTCI